MTTRLAHPLLTATLSLSLGLAGCAADGELPVEETFNDADSIASALELENGGLQMTDERPLFDESDLFQDSDLVQTDVRFDDAMERDAEVQAILGDVDAVLYHTTVMWGQIPGDRENDTVFNWSGTLSINRGAMIVRSVLAFDGRTDRLAPRTDRRAVSFRSLTLPHRDGLRLLIVDPDPQAEEPLVLTWTQAEGDATFSAPLARIVGEPLSQDMDGAGNQIVAVAIAQPVDVCENGFLSGRWHRVAEHRGRILGRMVDAEGSAIGHVRGLYGQRDSGERVFFMKFIDTDGRFRGILRGTYGDGHFVGRWVVRDGDRVAERGVLGGEFRETDAARTDANTDRLRVGGHFLGRWAERTCNLVIDG